MFQCCRAKLWAKALFILLVLTPRLSVGLFNNHFLLDFSPKPFSPNLITLGHVPSLQLQDVELYSFVQVM